MSPKVQAQKQYDGPPQLVAKELLWGPGRLWLLDEMGEENVHWRAQKSENIGVLASGLGGRAALLAAQNPAAALFEFDWRDDVLAWRSARDQHGSSSQAQSPNIHEVNMSIALPPPVRCQYILAIEPLLAQSDPALLRWARAALSAGGILELEELVTDSVSAPPKERCAGWMTTDGGAGQWLRIEELSGALRHNGFVVGKTRERTGPHLRALRLAIDVAEGKLADLEAAIKLVPGLQKVADHFNCEHKAAKNRLKALEKGDLAVYRMEVIKPRAEELI